MNTSIVIKTFKGIFTLACLLAFNLTLYGQNDMEDVVYLKNKSILRGQIIEINMDASVTIEISGGSRLVYPMSEVDRITREASKSHKSQKEVRIKEQGYFNSTEIGITTDMSAFSVHNVNGYYFNRFLGVGVGLGIDGGGVSDHDLYVKEEDPFFNIYLRGEWQLFESKITPFYFLDIGYGIPLFTSSRSDNMGRPFLTFQRTTTELVEGGWMFDIGMGVRLHLHTPSRISGQLTLGYKLQRSIVEDKWWWEYIGLVVPFDPPPVLWEEDDLIEHDLMLIRKKRTITSAWPTLRLGITF